MKIFYKIILLILVLISGLTFVALTGLRQMADIRDAYAARVSADVDFMNRVHEVSQAQLKKEVLLTQLISVAEEMGYETVSFSRQQYLMDQLKNMRTTFLEYANTSANTARIIHIAAGGGELKATAMRLENTRSNYDAAVMRLLDEVESGGFKLSLEHVEKFQTDAAKLSKDANALLNASMASLKKALSEAKGWEKSAFLHFMGMLGMMVVVAMMLSMWMVRSLVKPITTLNQATRSLASGQLNVNVPVFSKDELAELGQAFNDMSRKLDEYRQHIETQNKQLKTANEDVDKFIHLMGHDILNPLTMMIAYCSYIEQHAGKSMDEKNLESLQGIRKAASRMHDMVKQMVEFTKSKRLS